jgi:hypothetical protein
MTPQDQVLTHAASKERRRNLTLREHFETAQKLLKPLLGSPDSHTGGALYRAMHQLHARFPELSDSEIEALVASVVRSVQVRASRKGQ